MALSALPLAAQTACALNPEPQIVTIKGATSGCTHSVFEVCLPGETITFNLVPFPNHPPLDPCDFVRWSFGDGTPDVNVSGSVIKVTHKYTSSGYHLGSVTVTSPAGSHYTDGIGVFIAETISFANSSETVAESDNVAHIKLVRTGSDRYDPLTVFCYTTDGTATNGRRYYTTRKTVQFVWNSPEATFDVPLINDHSFSGTQTFYVSVEPSPSDVHYIVGAPYQIPVKILDDEAPPVLSFSNATYTANENSGSATITVNRTGNLAPAVSVHYATRDTNSPAVVTPVSGTLNFATNATSASFNVPITDDDLPLGNKQIFIDLTSPFGATLAGDVSTLTATLKINDNDPLPAVTIADISIAEGDSGKKDATFHLTLSQPVRNSTPVAYTMTDGTARRGSDYEGSSGTIVFAPGETSKTLDVPVIGDTTAEANETFNVAISSTLASVTRSSGICTIVNDDAGISPATSEMSRGSKRSLTIKLPQACVAAASIDLSVANSQIASVPDHVIMPAGASSASFTVTATAAGKTTIRATLPDSLGGQTLTASVTVNESPSVSFDPATLTIAPGAVASESVRIDPSLPVDVMVSLQVDDPTVVSVPSFVTVPAGGSATIPVTGLRAGTATLTATLPATNGGGSDTLPVTVADTPMITNITPSSGPSAGGTPVTIQGRNFSAACTVSFGSRPAASTEFGDASTLIVTTPSHDAGTTTVTVDCGGMTASASDAFTFMPGRRRPSR